jgi:CelD/BcsL family acetyltransferase involved in cellulose biosynthesis
MVNITNCGEWQCVSSDSDLLELKSDWERLFQENSAHSPFLAWGWVCAWLRHIAGNHEPRILCWRDDGGELQFVLPLIIKIDGRRFRRNRIMLACGYGLECSDHLGCLRKPVHDSRLAEISAYALDRFFGSQGRIQLPFLNCVDEYPAKLGMVVRASGRKVRLKNDAVCPIVGLPNTWEGYLQLLSRNFRSQVNRSYRRIVNHENLSFRSIGVSHANSFTDELIRLNRSRMYEKGDVSSLENESFRHFMVEAVPYMALHGIAWMDAIVENGKSIGLALNFAHGNSVHFYMGGFDMAAKKLQPGTALFVLNIKRAIEREYREYDFLRGAEEYKYRWGAKDRVTQTIDIYPYGPIRGDLAWAIDGASFRIRTFLRRVHGSISNRSF